MSAQGGTGFTAVRKLGVGMWVELILMADRWVTCYAVNTGSGVGQWNHAQGLSL